MNVLNVGQNHYVRGGSDKYFFDLGTMLRERDHDVHVFAAAHSQNLPTADSGFFPPPVDFEKPRVNDLIRFVYNRGAAKNLAAMLATKKFDVAHLHIYYGQLSSSILNSLKRGGVPVVQTLHEYRVVCPTSHLVANGEPCERCDGHKFYRAIVQRCNRGSVARSALSAIETYVAHANGAVSGVDHFIAVSEFLRQKVISLGVPASKVTTIHNFVDARRFAPTSDRGSYILFYGRLELIKGLMTLLEAARTLPEVTFVIAGEGAARGAMESFIGQHSLTNVKLVGFQSGAALHSLIRGAICTVTPSEWYETFGLTLVESFALGRPVICSDMGGMPEIVTDGYDGYVVPPGNPELLAQRIARLHGNPDLAIEMGRAGRFTAEDRFSPDAHIERVESVYTKVAR